MTPQAPTIFSLQAPKDISLTEIEAELNQIWQSYGITGEDGGLPAATRATTFTLVVYEPEETQYLLAALGFYNGPIDGILGPQTEAALRQVQTNIRSARNWNSNTRNSDRIAGRICQTSRKRQQGTADNGGMVPTALMQQVPPLPMKLPSVTLAALLLCFPLLVKMKE